MSTILSCLVIVLLCCSFHACNARNFRVVLHKDTTKKSDQHSITKKNDEKLNPARVSTQPDTKSSIPNATKDAKVENIIKKEKIINNESDEPGKHLQATKVINSTKVSSDTAKDESPSYVSWRVPHKKRGEQEPGFNLDYLPPKTHPPVHN